LIYPSGIAKGLSIDEVVFIIGFLYTIVVIIKGVKVDQVAKCLN